jgi:hypothetical protein
VAEQPVVQPSIDLKGVHVLVDDVSSIFAVPFSETVHQYNVKSRGRDYALITVFSHAVNAQDPPLLYFGEELEGFVMLSLNDLSGMQRLDVVVS